MFWDIFVNSLALIVVFVVVGQLIAGALSRRYRGKHDG
jgi:hypothetical protein